MLRDVPPFSRDADDSTVFMTGASGGHIEHEHNETIDPLDDVFGSPPASPGLHAADSTTERSTFTDHSDISRLRSTHVTNGYREGIAESKESHMQEGFDEGYTLGAELGLRIGWCLGALRGIWHALPGSRSDSSADGHSPTREDVQVMLSDAERELEMQQLFSKEYFGEDGLWLYDVPDSGAEKEEPTFEEIAAAHPVVLIWTGKVNAMARQLNLRLQ